MGFLVMISQFILSLSILIILHECGHFFPAKWFKTRVEKFYLFFDVKFSLFKKKIGETVYGIGWLPLGGYVKIAGMVDESFDTKNLSEEPEPWEFRAKPAWQRLIIMLGGVFVNFILGFLIFGLLLWKYGEEYLPAEQLKWGVAVDSLAMEMGLEDGDKILRVGDREFDEFNSGILREEIAINNQRTIDVIRAGTEKRITIAPEFVGKLASYEYKDFVLIVPAAPSIVGEVTEGMPAEKAGLLKGDKILGFNGENYPFSHVFARKIREYRNEDIRLDVLRNDRDTLQLSVKTTDEGTIGFTFRPLQEFFEFETRHYSFSQAMPKGVIKGVGFLSTQIKAFGQMFKGKIKPSDGLGGFGTISKLFPEQWNWSQFWNITAILSLILGFMNLLPIPGLDGGHVMFLLFEMISGRKPSDKFLERATMVGFVLLIALLLYANGLDVWRWLKK